MNKKVLSLLAIISIMIISMTGCSLKNKEESTTNQNTEYEDSVSVLSSSKDINLRDINGNKTNFVFTYKNEEFSAKYTKDNWHIKDSYKITNKYDIAYICKALTDVHPIHGKDMKSYRTIDDLVYEWRQHNLAYVLLSDDNKWKAHAKDVDLDPADQGRSLEEMYEARTGAKLDKTKLKKIKDSRKVQKLKNKLKEVLE